MLALSHVWHLGDGEEHVIAAKGAPEAVADLCHFDSAQLKQLSAQVDAMANDGLRVLGIAKAAFSGDAWPQTQHDFDYEFLGLVGLADPVRPAVPGAIRECYRAGVRVVMITGDYPSTAQAIARKIGLRKAEDLLTGEIEPGLHDSVGIQGDTFDALVH